MPKIMSRLIVSIVILALLLNPLVVKAEPAVAQMRLNPASAVFGSEALSETPGFFFRSRRLNLHVTVLSVRLLRPSGASASFPSRRYFLRATSFLTAASFTAIPLFAQRALEPEELRSLLDRLTEPGFSMDDRLQAAGLLLNQATPLRQQSLRNQLLLYSAEALRHAEALRQTDALTADFFVGKFVVPLLALPGIDRQVLELFKTTGIEAHRKQLAIWLWGLYRSKPDQQIDLNDLDFYVETMRNPDLADLMEALLEDTLFKNTWHALSGVPLENGDPRGVTSMARRLTILTALYQARRVAKIAGNLEGVDLYGAALSRLVQPYDRQALVMYGYLRRKQVRSMISNDGVTRVTSSPVTIPETPLWLKVEALAELADRGEALQLQAAAEGRAAPPLDWGFDPFDLGAAIRDPRQQPSVMKLLRIMPTPDVHALYEILDGLTKAREEQRALDPRSENPVLESMTERIKALLATESGHGVLRSWLMADDQADTARALEIMPETDVRWLASDHEALSVLIERLPLTARLGRLSQEAFKNFYWQDFRQKADFERSQAQAIAQEQKNSILRASIRSRLQRPDWKMPKSPDPTDYFQNTIAINLALGAGDDVLEDMLQAEKDPVVRGRLWELIMFSNLGFPMKFFESPSIMLRAMEALQDGYGRSQAANGINHLEISVLTRPFVAVFLKALPALENELPPAAVDTWLEMLPKFPEELGEIYVSENDDAVRARVLAALAKTTSIDSALLGVESLLPEIVNDRSHAEKRDAVFSGIVSPELQWAGTALRLRADAPLLNTKNDIEATIEFIHHAGDLNDWLTAVRHLPAAALARLHAEGAVLQQLVRALMDRVHRQRAAALLPSLSLDLDARPSISQSLLDLSQNSDVRRNPYELDEISRLIGADRATVRRLSEEGLHVYVRKMASEWLAAHKIPAPLAQVEGPAARWALFDRFRRPRPNHGLRESS